MNNYVQVAKNILGEDIFEELKKTELYKLGTNTTLDPEEMKIAMQIVPRAVLSYLTAELKPMKDSGVKELHIPFVPNAIAYITKISNDVYMGEITQDNKKKAEFKYRSLPGIGLILMSTFELYDMNDLETIKPEPSESSKYDKMQQIIDDRMRLHCLIKDVVDHRISERDAIKQLIAEKISEQFNEIEESEDEEYEEEDDFSLEMSDDETEESGEGIMDNLTKKSKLKEFLESREKKRTEKVHLDKSEKIDCPDCNTDLYKGENHIKLCLCYGEHFNKEIKVKKTEDGRYKFNFPKSFDTDNVEMLLEAIKSNKR